MLHNHMRNHILSASSIKQPHHNASTGASSWVTVEKQIQMKWKTKSSENDEVRMVPTYLFTFLMLSSRLSEVEEDGGAAGGWAGELESAPSWLATRRARVEIIAPGAANNGASWVEWRWLLSSTISDSNRSFDLRKSFSSDSYRLDSSTVSGGEIFYYSLLTYIHNIYISKTLWFKGNFSWLSKRSEWMKVKNKKSPIGKVVF